MKTRTINYHKVFNLGNFSNEKIGVDLELEPGDDPQKAIENARSFCENQHQLSVKKERYLEACDIITRPEDYTGRQIDMAKRVKDEYESMLTNTPKLLQA